MIYDSQEQKDFVFKILRGYNCSYAESLIISQTYALAVQTGAVIPVKDQQEMVDKIQRQNKKLQAEPPSKNGKSNKKGEKVVH